MNKGAGKLLQGDALLSRAKELGLSPLDFPGADGGVDEDAIRWRIRQVERYSSEFHIFRLLVVCVAAFVACGIATWLAMRWLGRP